MSVEPDRYGSERQSDHRLRNNAEFIPTVRTANDATPPAVSPTIEKILVERHFDAALTVPRVPAAPDRELHGDRDLRPHPVVPSIRLPSQPLAARGSALGESREPAPQTQPPIVPPKIDVEPARQALSVEPTIEIRIGRLEVRGHLPERKPAPAAPPSAPGRGTATLDDYMRRRQGGRR
ncbi:MAG: hypothetical protein K1X74_16685 [Pirellulales bacterium]|nr:hypothetical protein [Pirellulales bacterium]